MYPFFYRNEPRHFAEKIQMEMAKLMEKNWEILIVFGQWEFVDGLNNLGT